MDGQASDNASSQSRSAANTTSLTDGLGSTGVDSVPQPKKLRRSFKACAHCRSRKAKCDLGDLNNPREPPCTRCKREGVPCTFLASKRGGRIPFAARQAKLEAQEKGSAYAASEQSSDGTGMNKSEEYGEFFTDSVPPFDSGRPSNITISPRFANPEVSLPGNASSTALSSTPYFGSSLSMPSSLHNVPLYNVQPNTPLQSGQTSLSNTTQGHVTGALGFSPPSSNMTVWNIPASSQPPASTHPNSFHTYNHNAGQQPTPTSVLFPGSNDMANNLSGNVATALPSGNSQLIQGPTQRKKRKAEEAVQPETLAAAKLHNPVDALNLLVLAADRKGKGRSIDDGTLSASHASERGITGFQDDRGGRSTSPASSDSDSDEVPHAPYTLSDFPLVKRKIISQMELVYYINLFFSKVHHIFPIVPYKRIPTNEAELTKFVKDEIHLTSVFILLASRNDIGGSRSLDIHNATWIFLQELISDLVFGKTPSVGAVEALLLLSDNPPREVVKNGPPGSAEESRMSWMLVGTAVRLGYMLGLDQTTLVPSIAETDDTPEGIEAREKLDRERIAWTYCYIFDRQMAIRTGKAFWSRGPGLCFTGSSEKSFPSMAPVAGMQDDFASLILAYVEITQIMTNAHDILYPSRDRTISLVKIGEYYKYLDELTRTLNNFRFTWENKKWQTFPLTELVWITFHYLRLYIYAFAFQAHIQRAGSRDFAPVVPHTGKPIPIVSMFPKGPMGSPDAKFILEAIDAAADLVRICTDRLHPQGILAFLPWRYFLYLTYAGVFLLKAVYVNAVPSGDHRTIVKLIQRLIVCLACGSKDEHHHSVRYARLLNSLLRSFSRGQDGLGTASGPPTSRHTPEATSQPDLPAQQDPQPSHVLQTAGFSGASASFNPSSAFASGPSDTTAQQSTLFGTPGLPSYPTSDFFTTNMPNLSSNQFLTDGLASKTAQEEQTAANLLSDDFNLDFVFSGMEPSTSTFDYSNLMDETTWDFWASLSGNPPEL